ncbi:DUF1294 domain-containing protein [Comamonas odontotermitis]|uniref:DUF1294 domain-containing protein n=1 Tax=Comamonas odontotermitis TaxID=379895 RepID=UPI003751AAE2
MRFEGTLQSWNDERGFGFIAADQGGDPVFVHIKAFGPGAARPQAQQRLSFEVEPGPEGKKRARKVQLVRPRAGTAGPATSAGRPARGTQQRSPASARSAHGSARWGTASLFALPAFALLVVVLGVLWHPPSWLLWWYAGLSALTFVIYALDKSAAQSGRWRTKESTLHLLALGGGWPGALVAQQLLRHKSAKTEFRAVFWLTVLLNVAALVYVCSPAGRHLLPY